MTAKAPACLTRRLSTTHLHEVNRWWGSLAPEEHRTLRQTGRPAPAGVLVRFVEPGSEGNVDETIDFYEHLVNHEVFLGDGRTFHICSAHPEARACLARGFVPAGFRCPRADAACPMRVLLDAARGSEVRLSLLAAPSNEEGAHG